MTPMIGLTPKPTRHRVRLRVALNGTVQQVSRRLNRILMLVVKRVDHDAAGT